MSTSTESQSRRERSWIYITSCILLGAVLIAGLIAFRGARETARAEDKADELIAALEEQGARTPDRDLIVRVLGDDGGATCQDPNAALNKATLFSLLSNGASGPGLRPVVAESRAVRGQLLIIETYCPDELDDFKKFVDDLETDEHVDY